MVVGSNCLTKTRFCVPNMCERSQWVAKKVKKGCQTCNEESETETIVEEKKKPTTLSTPVLISSLELSSVGPARTWVGDCLGINSRCCRLFFFHYDLSFTFFIQRLTSFLYFLCNPLGLTFVCRICVNTPNG